MSKNTGRNYQEKKTNKLLRALNSMSLGITLDWLYRAQFALKDKEPLSLERYLVETVEVAKADKRMKKIDEEVELFSSDEKDRRRQVLDKEKEEGVGELIW